MTRDEGLPIETSAFLITVRWPIYIIKRVDRTNFFVYHSPNNAAPQFLLKLILSIRLCREAIVNETVGSFEHLYMLCASVLFTYVFLILDWTHIVMGGSGTAALGH